MNKEQQSRDCRACVRSTLGLFLLSIIFFTSASVSAGVKFEHSDTVWLSIGGGARMQLDSRKSDLDNNSEVSSYVAYRL